MTDSRWCAPWFFVSRCWNALLAWSMCSGWPITEFRWCAPCLGVEMHSSRDVSVRGDRCRSVGGALRSFLRLCVETHSLRGIGVRGGRWWSLGGAHRSFHWSPRFRCVRTSRIKKLWSAPPRLRHRFPRIPRPRKERIPTPRRKKLWSAPPRLRHRLPRIPRPGKERIPTPRRKTTERTTYTSPSSTRNT